MEMEQAQGAKAPEQEEVWVAAVEAAEAEVEWAAIGPVQDLVVSAAVQAVAQKYPIKSANPVII